MVRKYKKKKEQKYSSDALDAAADAVVNKLMTLTEASEAFDVPKSTINDKVIGKHEGKVGHKTVLTTEEERHIVDCILHVSKFGWPMNRQDVGEFANQYCKRASKNVPWDITKGPGKDFLLGFENRWKDKLTLRKTENLTTARAKSLTKDRVEKFFDIIIESYEKYDLNNHPERIYNLDETGLNTDCSGSKCYFRKGARTTSILNPTCGKATYTVLVCANADGSHLLPPFVVYKSKYLHDTWCKGGPSGSSFGNSISGWMETNVFYNWLKNIYIQHKKKVHGDKHVALIMDGYGSHLTYDVANLCKENNIVLICIPPQSSHALQPLDVGFFQPMKVLWRSTLRDWFRQTRLQKVDKAVFPSLLKMLWLKLKAKNSASGFRGAGLYPIDISKPLTKLLGEEDTYSSATSSPISKNVAKAVMDVLSPPQRVEVKFAKKNSETRRKRVQASCGEVLTETDALNRLNTEGKAPPKKTKLKLKEQNVSFSDQCESDDNITRTIEKMPGDGNCLFSSVAQGLYGEHTEVLTQYLRMKAVTYAFENWDYFESFGIKHLHEVETAEEYYRKMSNSKEYGDQTEIEALSKAFDVQIEVYTNGNLHSATCTHNAEEAKQKKVIRIHHRNVHYDHVKFQEGATSRQTKEGEKESPENLNKEWALIKFQRKKGPDLFYIGKIDSETRGAIDVHYVLEPFDERREIYTFPEEEDKDVNIPSADWTGIKNPTDKLINRKFCYEFLIEDLLRARLLLQR